MDESPFIRLSRRFFKNFLWTERRTFSRAEAWLDLLQNSAYEPQKRMEGNELIDVPRGGIVASERFLSDRWMWSRTKVRAFINLLISEGMLEKEPRKDHQKDHPKSVFLLCNYEKYNSEKDHPDIKKKTKKEPPQDIPPSNLPLLTPPLVLPSSKDREVKKARASSQNEILEFCREINTPDPGLDSQDLWMKWNENGWKNQGQPIKDWKMTARRWSLIGVLASQRNGNGHHKPTEPREKHSMANGHYPHLKHEVNDEFWASSEPEECRKELEQYRRNRQP